MIWVHQKSTFEIGNFISMTPAIEELAFRYKCKIPVYFDTPTVKELYKHCPYIKILDSKPDTPPTLRTGKMKRLTGQSDYDAYLNSIGADVTPRPYVDSCFDEDIEDYLPRRPHPWVAVIHGCLGSYWLEKKDLGEDWRIKTLRWLDDNGYIPIVLGSQRDHELFWQTRLQHPVDTHMLAGMLTIRQSVAILNRCKFFISNDTGFMHIAGALGKHGYAVWKDTDFVKNRPPSKEIKHIDFYTRTAKYD